MLWTTDDVAKTYSRLAPRWDQKSQKMRVTIGNSNRLREILPQILDGGEKSLLDFGCGTGKIYQNLYTANMKLRFVAMVDASIDMCKLAAEKVGKKIPAKIINGNEHSFQIYENSPYDIITLMQVLHHLPNPCETLFELRKYGIEDTMLIALVPGPLYQSNIFPYEKSDQIDSIGRLPPEKWECILKKSGWEIETIYDDRFYFEFSSETEYFSFIVQIGLLSKINSYSDISDVGNLEPIRLDIQDGDEIRVYGQHITFVCRLKGS